MITNPLVPLGAAAILATLSLVGLAVLEARSPARMATRERSSSGAIALGLALLGVVAISVICGRV